MGRNISLTKGQVIVSEILGRGIVTEARQGRLTVKWMATNSWGVYPELALRDSIKRRITRLA